MRITTVTVLVVLPLLTTALEPFPSQYLTPPKSPASQLGSSETDGVFSFQRIAKWLWPGSTQQLTEGRQVSPDLGSKGTSLRGTKLDPTKKGKNCNPCNSVPWVPIARALGYGKPNHGDSSGHYSLQIPTISLTSLGKEYGPPKSEYGQPKPEYGPPKPEYGPPKPEYGPPKPEYGPPKPEYGPPKPEYGPPKPEYGPPKPEYGVPKPEYGPPKAPPQQDYGYSKPPDHGPPPEYGIPPPPEQKPHLEYGPPKTLNSEYGPPPPKPERKPHLEYGPPKTPSSEYGPPPPKPEQKPHSEYGPPLVQSEYGPPKTPPNFEYGPPQSNPEQNAPKPEYGPPLQSSYGPPKSEPGPSKPLDNYGPPLPKPKPGYGTPFLVPYQFMSQFGQSLHGARQKPAPYLPPTKFRGPPSPLRARYPRPPASHPPGSEAVYLSPPPLNPGQQYHSLIFPPTAFSALSENPSLSNTDQSSCNKCPPTSPDLSAGLHQPPTTEEAKSAIGNFGNLPLSDSAIEASNVAPSPGPSTSNVGNYFSPHQQVQTTKSAMTSYLSSIEYPMQIVQAPILDVPDLPKYFDLGFHTFLANHQRNRIEPDTDKAHSNQSPVSVNLLPKPNPTKTTQATTKLSTIQVPSQQFNTHQNTTTYEAVPTSNWAPSHYSPHPFIQATTPSPKKNKQIHQIIVPYTTGVKQQPQARKVPNGSTPDLQAIYVNRGVTSPEGPTDINFPLTATGSEHLEMLQSPDVSAIVDTLPPDVVNKLLQIGINPNEPNRNAFQHILATTDLKALLRGEEDTIDLHKLQKNIDQWTVEGFGKRDNPSRPSHASSKKIPDEYFTTTTGPEVTETRLPPSSSGREEMSTASQIHAFTYDFDKQVTDELNGWSLVETKVKEATTTTQRPWERVNVTIVPKTNEKVYVVTPQTVFPSGPSESTTMPTNASQRVTRQLMASPGNESTEKVNIVTPISESTESNVVPGEVEASVKYIGSASSLSNSKIAFQS